MSDSFLLLFSTATCGSNAVALWIRADCSSVFSKANLRRLCFALRGTLAEHGSSHILLFSVKRFFISLCNYPCVLQSEVSAHQMHTTCVSTHVYCKSAHLQRRHCRTETNALLARGNQMRQRSRLCVTRGGGESDYKLALVH